MKKIINHSGTTKPDYSAAEYQPCWTCQNSCGGCNWSREFKPVDGWEAEKTILISNGEYADSYRIISCPEYKRG